MCYHVPLQSRPLIDHQGFSRFNKKLYITEDKNVVFLKPKTKRSYTLRTEMNQFHCLVLLDDLAPNVGCCVGLLALDSTGGDVESPASV